MEVQTLDFGQGYDHSHGRKCLKRVFVSNVVPPARRARKNQERPLSLPSLDMQRMLRSIQQLRPEEQASFMSQLSAFTAQVNTQRVAAYA